MNKATLLVAMTLCSLSCRAQPPERVNKFHLAPSLKPPSSAVAAHTPDLDGFPIAPGWPLALPGPVLAAPVVADIGGDGEIEIVVPCMAHRSNAPLVHPTPDVQCQLFAFHYDGTPLKGWPAVLLTDEQRKAARTGDWAPYANNWYASPSVLPLPTGDEIVVTCPDEGNWARCVRRVNARGAILELTDRGDGWGSVPLVDIDGNQIYDVLIGEAAADVNGGTIGGWSPTFKLPEGYAPAIGDANGDGKLEIYHPNHERDWAQGDKPQNCISAFDHKGKPLPGWPQKLGRVAQYVVMGDVSGDDKMEIISLDVEGGLNVWMWDGKPAPGTHAIGERKAVLKTGVEGAYKPLTLADLDGDGKAEIICFDYYNNVLKAWHGDGRGVTGEASPARTAR